MNKYISLLLVSVLFLPSCSAVGVATGVGASAGIAASQEGGITRAVSDARIQIEINNLWFQYDVETFSKLDMTINQGRVLITGVVQDPEHRVEAVRLAWQPRGVKQVINEVRVAESEGIIGFAKDTWITTRIRTSLIFDSAIESVNYSVDTVQGSVYLMGFAQNREELNRVIETARTINGVESVVSYVKFVGGPDEVPDTAQNPYNAQVEPSYDSNNYQDQQVQPAYVDDMPLDLRAPQNNPQTSNTYPNNVEPVQIERLDRPVIIRDQPPAQPIERQGIEREDILWNER